MEEEREKMRKQQANSIFDKYPGMALEMHNEFQPDADFFIDARFKHPYDYPNQSEEDQKAKPIV